MGSAGRCGKKVDFSFEEDIDILDIATNPGHPKKGVPWSVWEDVVKTANFGDKTVGQLQTRYKTIRRETQTRADGDGVALLDVGPPVRVDFSFDEDIHILDITTKLNQSRTPQKRRSCHVRSDVSLTSSDVRSQVT